MRRFAKILIVLIAVASFVVGGTTMKYKVNPDICISCQACVGICPTKAISMLENKAFIDAEKCIGCGACASVCPVKAISKDTLVAVDTTVSH